jgi:NADH dehydrogenase
MKIPLNGQKKRIVILGGGFGGVYTAIYLEKLLKKSSNFEIVLVNKENYFVYQPMLAEVVGGSLGLIDTVSSLKKLLPKTTIYVREILQVDLHQKKIILAPEFNHTNFELSYDYLVFALGNVTDFKGIPGIHEHALPFKNLADSITIRNQLIEVVEAAACEENPRLRKELLTFVIGGGGFSGTEVAAEINDFVRSLVKKYKNIDPKEVRVVLVHSQKRLMDRELSESLGNYSGKLLAKRGVEIRFGQRLTSATPSEAVIDGKERIPAKTIVSTVPSSPNPVIEKLALPLEKGKIKTSVYLGVENHVDLWAIGDCALIPTWDGKGFCPPTAQFAIREAKTLAHNLVAALGSKPLKPFKFTCIGMLGALGHHRAVAELFGRIKFSGFFAWLLWRAIYWIKLPGFDRKLKVAFSWFLDAIVPIEAVQLKLNPGQGVINFHYEEGDVIFNEGDVGDYFYIIVSGQVEVLKRKGGEDRRLAVLNSGEYFGEMAILNDKKRSATIRCLTACDVIALRNKDFGALLSNLDDLKKGFMKKSEERTQAFERFSKDDKIA